MPPDVSTCSKLQTRICAPCVERGAAEKPRAPMGWRAPSKRSSAMQGECRRCNRQAARKRRYWPLRRVLMEQSPIVPAQPIILAHEPPFRIGDAEIRPATREYVYNGHTSIGEPRVMQMLVALHRADGGVVSKDDLIGLCWEGRVVGEDAINRV